MATVNELLTSIRDYLAGMGQTLQSIASALIAPLAQPVPNPVQTLAQTPTPTPAPAPQAPPANPMTVLTHVVVPPTLPTPTPAPASNPAQSGGTSVVNNLVTPPSLPTPTVPPQTTPAPATTPATTLTNVITPPSLPTPTVPPQAGQAPISNPTKVLTNVVTPPVVPAPGTNPATPGQPGAPGPQAQAQHTVLHSLLEITKLLKHIDQHIQKPSEPKSPAQKNESLRGHGFFSTLSHIVHGGVGVGAQIAAGKSPNLMGVDKAAANVVVSGLKSVFRPRSQQQQSAKPVGPGTGVQAADNVLGEVVKGGDSLLDAIGKMELFGFNLEIVTESIKALAVVAAGVYLVWTGLEGASVTLSLLLEGFGNNLLDAQKRLANFSGSMSQVFARREIFQTFQNVKMGEQTAASTANLEAALENVGNILLPIKAAVTNLMNNSVAELLNYVSKGIPDMTDSLAVVVESLKDLPIIGDAAKKSAETLHDIARQMREQKEPKSQLNDWFEDINRGVDRSGYLPSRGWSF